MKWRWLITLIALGSVACDDGPDGPTCGDMIVEPGEECDDGNRMPGDGCDATCHRECGNGTLDTGEECDDGNREAGDGCDSSCRRECGNGRLDPGEECDFTITSGCNEQCRWETNPDADADSDVDADSDADADSDVDADSDADADSDSDVVALPRPGASVSLWGELSAASDTWIRPDRDCETLSEREAPLEVYRLRNGQSSTINATIDALAAGSGEGTLADTMIFLYEGSSVPADPTTCVASDDDGGEGLDSRLEGISFSPGRTYTLVVTTYRSAGSDDAFGTFRLEIATE